MNGYNIYKVNMSTLKMLGSFTTNTYSIDKVLRRRQIFVDERCAGITIVLFDFSLFLVYRVLSKLSSIHNATRDRMPPHARTSS